MAERFLLTPEDGGDVPKAVAAPARMAILTLLYEQGAMNMNDIAAELNCRGRVRRPI